MMSYLHTKFHDNCVSSFRGVAMTRFLDRRTDRQTDGVTALLDLLSPLATQVKMTFSRVVLSLKYHQHFKNKTIDILGDDWPCPVNVQ